MSIREALLENLPQNSRTQAIYVGNNWVLSLISANDGTQYAGVAAAPRQFTGSSRFPPGHYSLDKDASTIAQLLRSDDNSKASVGLATVNALLQVGKITVSNIDAANWLTQVCTDRSIAIFGRFPFIDEEVRPFASQVWIFEQHPQKGEYSADDMSEILPQANVIAITSSTIINHTINGILSYISTDSITALLGPSTPLSTKLFKYGIDALFGVQVFDIQKVTDSVQAGADFRKMHGLGRVSLFKT